MDFDPNYMVNKTCDVNKQKLTITYSEHPQKDTIDLIGEVVFPNLKFNVRHLDFGAILNGTQKSMLLHMSNPFPLAVDYQWMLVDEMNDVEYVNDGMKVKVPMGQIFDILPIAGRLDSGDSLDVQLTYMGIGNKKVPGGKGIMAAIEVPEEKFTLPQFYGKQSCP